jgi:hypothetical protein
MAAGDSLTTFAGMKQRIYIDTSVVGGFFDEEFKEATIKMFERLENNEVIFVVSELLDIELINAPAPVRTFTCRHIALATIKKVDVLASWNFKHIVNLDRIKGYNSVNLRLGYSLLEIRSPKDLVNYGND